MKSIYFVIVVLLMLTSCVVEETISSTAENENPNLDYPLSNIDTPSQGVLGEYIIMSAVNLKSNKLQFKFNDIIADAYQVNIDTVRVQVPRNVGTVNSQITVIVNATDSLIHTSGFQLKTPQISGVEKTIVEFGENVWVYGENFDEDSSYLEVKLNGVNVGVNESTRDSLQITIPNTLNVSEIDLEITAQLQIASVQQIMTLKTPEITSVDQSVQVGGIMEVVGVNFTAEEENGQFIINDEILAHTISVENNNIARLRVPYGPYEDFEIYKISYEVAGLQAELNTNILIDSDYILYTKNNIAPTTRVRHYNNKSYMFASDDQDANGVPVYSLYELDYTTRAWSKISSVSISGYNLRVTMSDNGEMFVFMSQFNDTNNTFYKVDLNNYSLQSINAPVNNPLRVSPALFYLNNQLFFGKGRAGSGTTDSYYTDLYSYNITNQTWEVLNTDTTEFYSDTDYDFQNNKYVSSYTVQTGTVYELKLFNPTNNTFTAVVPASTYTTENVFPYLNKFLRVAIVPSTDLSYFYEIESQSVITTLNTQQFPSTSRYFAKDDKVFFYSFVNNDIYAPSNGFYLINPQNQIKITHFKSSTFQY